MTKLLAIVEPTEDGFRGYVPRLPGCEVHAATAEQTEVDLTAAARAHLAAHREGTNGFDPDRVEIVVVVEPPPPAPRQRGDGLDEIFNKMGSGFNPEELEFFLNLDEQKFVSFEEVMSELGFAATEESSAEATE